jgi:hypothetical protein
MSLSRDEVKKFPLFYHKYLIYRGKINFRGFRSASKKSYKSRALAALVHVVHKFIHRNCNLAGLFEIATKAGMSVAGSAQIIGNEVIFNEIMYLALIT